MNVQIGGTAGTAATSLVDTNKIVVWDDLTTLLWRNASLSSWTVTLGTKQGSGDQASGVSGCEITFGTSTTLRGTVNLYGCTLRNVKTNTSVTWTPGITGSFGEAVDCIFQSTAVGAGTAFTFGAATQKIDNFYNVDISSVTQIPVVNFFINTAERVTIATTSGAALLATNGTAISTKDCAVFGTPATSDYRWNAGSPNNWIFVRPLYTNSVAKFTGLSSGVPTLANSTKEYWLFNVKVVGSTGAAIENIPVTLTDTLGNVQVSATTDENGQISFGSGLTANGVIVVDHYRVTTTYTQQHRSPFLLEVNTGNERDQTRQSLRTRFYWPGYEGYTTTAGTFEDVNVIVPLETASGTPTSWTEHEMP